MLPPLPPGWFIVPLTQIPALWNVCVCVITDRQGRLPAAPAEQLRECFVLPCVLQEIPPAALALGTALQAEHEMLWCMWQHEAPSQLSHTGQSGSCSMQCPAASPCLCCQCLCRIQLHHSPSTPFQRKSWAALHAGGPLAQLCVGRAQQNMSA